MTMTEAPQRHSELDDIVTQMRGLLRRDTISIIEKGKLLLRSRELLEHGQWQAWLMDNFDLSIRTAQNYCVAAEYVARAVNGGSATISDFGNVSPIDGPTSSTLVEARAGFATRMFDVVAIGAFALFDAIELSIAVASR